MVDEATLQLHLLSNKLTLAEYEREIGKLVRERPELLLTDEQRRLPLVLDNKPATPKRHERRQSVAGLLMLLGFNLLVFEALIDKCVNPGLLILALAVVSASLWFACMPPAYPTQVQRPTSPPPKPSDSGRDRPVVARPKCLCCNGKQCVWLLFEGMYESCPLCMPLGTKVVDRMWWTTDSGEFVPLDEAPKWQRPKPEAGYLEYDNRSALLHARVRYWDASAAIDTLLRPNST